MIERNPISERLRTARDKVWDYLKGDPNDWPKDLQAEFYSGVPVGDVLKILASLAGATVAVWGAFKALKTIPEGYRGVRITLGRAHGKLLKEGASFTDPFRKFQRVVLVDMAPQEIDIPGGIKSLARDGTQITSDVTAVLEVGSPKDAVRVIHPKPKIRIKDEPEIVNTVGRFSDLLSREVIADRLSASGVTEGVVLKRLRQESQGLLQEVLDEIYLDERGRREVTEKRQRGIPRSQIRRGLIVRSLGFPNLDISEEVVEAMQESVGAPFRLHAEQMARAVMGPDYQTFRETTAAEQIARTGGTIVFGIGAVEGGVMGRIRDLEEKLEGDGGSQSMEEMRSEIDKLRGERG